MESSVFYCVSVSINNVRLENTEAPFDIIKGGRRSYFKSKLLKLKVKIRGSIFLGNVLNEDEEKDVNFELRGKGSELTKCYSFLTGNACGKDKVTWRHEDVSIKIRKNDMFADILKADIKITDENIPSDDSVGEE